ncbi:hypothetical protein [Chachezhania antarctica]|uniref:hypothetical protein n=1 Tax=Chachezhania antarctica TaxID=2340860 RepID=UPI000EB0357E|nr:hypothetical protein [Chachezhania antarctica]
MELVADILLVAGALGAGFYCYVLAQRLNRFNDLEKGVGGAVAVLSSQVDHLNKALEVAQNSSEGSSAALEALTERAESVAQRLELMMASMHDVPMAGSGAQPAAAPQQARAPEAPVKAAPPSDPAPDAADSTGPMFVRHDSAARRVAQ